MNIKFKTLDGDSYTVNFDNSLPIRELKNKISWELQVQEASLVLIFRGKRLQDNNKLEDYDFKEGNTLNVIARKMKKESTQVQGN
jgi:hypothetical protein